MSAIEYHSNSFDALEPILQPTTQRLIAKISYPDLWNLYERAVASFWTHHAIDMSKDYKDWESLNADERYFLSHVLAFFAASDGIVMENLCMRFSNEVQINEARLFYSFQDAMEGIHSVTYIQLLEHLIRDTKELNHLVAAIETVPSIKAKANWALKWISNKEASFAQRLISFAIVELIQFSGSFAAIFYMRKRGLLPGLCQSNAYIARDESLHGLFAITLYNHIQNKVPDHIIHAMVAEAVELEIEFFCDALPCALIGMNAESMAEYIRYVGDHLLESIDVPKLYNANMVFDFMESISLEAKENFFERKTTSYAKTGVVGNDQSVFALDADF